MKRPEMKVIDCCVAESRQKTWPWGTWGAVPESSVERYHRQNSSRVANVDSSHPASKGNHNGEQHHEWAELNLGSKGVVSRRNLLLRAGLKYFGFFHLLTLFCAG